MFYIGLPMKNNSQLFELRRRTFDTPHFRGIEFIEAEAKTIINHVPGNYLPFNYTINPYRGCSHACGPCFARVTHTFLDMDGGRDWETKIVVKVNAPEKLRFELGGKRWKGHHIAMGTSTDPYQRAEGRYKLTRGIIRALVDYRNPFSILTRSPLVLRDLDLLVEGAAITDVSAAFSVPSLDDDVWRKTESGAPHPKKRIEAVRKLNEAGIPTGVMVAPVIPGISDDPRMLMDAVRAAVDAGATFVTPILLHLRPVVREHFMDWLGETYPELVTRYDAMYGQGAYGPKQDRQALQQRVRGLVAAAGGLQPIVEPPARDRRWPRPDPSQPAPKQEQLQLL
jgi:DNA repair photolyase